MISRTASFSPLRWLAVFLCSILWTTLGSTAALAERGDSGCCSPAAKTPLPKCFSAGTDVETPDGERNIETIKAGDTVYAYDFETGQVVERRMQRSKDDDQR